MLAAVLGAVLAGEITGIALARTLPPVVVPVVAAPATPGAAVASGAGSDRQRIADLRDSRAERVQLGVDLPARLPAASGAAAHGRSLAAPAPRAATSTAPGKASTSTTAHAPAKAVSSTSFHGVNHVWIPSLGINKGVQSFPCSRTRPPDAGVYRWGCAGANNVYLLSHAWSTFKPLHDAYVRGTLRKGMKVWYADGGGHVHEYRVIWWRVTAPTTAASWAWAALPSPGMTLQTCVGANSENRLMVRLDRVD